MKTDLETLNFKNNLYRDYYRRVMFYLLVMVATAAVLSVVSFYQLHQQRKPLYFAATTTGRVVPLQSLSMPVVTNTFLLQWAALATRAAYNLDFVNTDKALAQASQYFTADGWKAFQAALTKAKMLESIKANKLFMTAVVDGAPVILNQAVVHGRYTWRVQLPLLVTYTSANEKHQSHFIVTLDIMRVPVIDVVKSIAINNFVVSSGSVQL